jgi:hypothetical protein
MPDQPHSSLSSACEHDWRVDPRVVLQSNPPRRRLVCAKCGAIDSGPAFFGAVVSTDNVQEWPKA